MINIVLGDITKLKVDCIVNAANNSLLGGGGVDGCIHAAAGIGLFLECKELGGCETGQSVITKGYNLPAKYVIHTVGPVYTGKPDNAKKLASCYWTALNLARAYGIHSIAFPSISTGVYGYPREEASKIALKTVQEWLEGNKSYDISIIFCCYDEKTYKIYQNLGL